jgi:diaminohydroxyphosphoribosylaminopyrimidine deaminase/5-amino-6-(5-phosphoribosylamino)uracil reductase
MLERAVELAERGAGTTHPNPVVGAVVARGDEVVGEGWHERKGGPHAEIVALEAAGEAARGATLYVTLEPCDHQGTTPPCVDAILAAGIARVVVGAKDPRREGIARLREAGVEVELVDLWEARQQNEAWLTWARLGRPFVTYKAAVTLDGRMAVPASAGSRARRAAGSSTSSAPPPTPWPSGWGPSGGRSASRRARRPRPPATSAPRVRERAAARGLRARAARGPLEDELQRLGDDGVQSLLLEGGPTIGAAFFEADLVDKLLLFVAPMSRARAALLRRRPLLSVCRRAGRWRRCPSDRLCPRALSKRDDRLITLISRWLARHIGNAELAHGPRRRATARPRSGPARSRGRAGAAA